MHRATRDDDDQLNGRGAVIKIDWSKLLQGPAEELTSIS